MFDLTMSLPSIRSLGTYSANSLPLRRPLHASIPSPQTLIQKLAIVPCDQPGEHYEKCVSVFENLATNNATAIEVIRHLHTACLLNGSLSRPMAEFLSALIEHRGEGGQFIRTQWLLLLQEDYEGRNLHFTSARGTFLNSVLFHGEVFNAVLVASAPIQVLAAPLTEYLKMVLESGSNEEYRLLLLQLLINGKKLREMCEKEYEGLLVEIRRLLLKTSSEHLLLALDISSNCFPHPKGPIRDFYLRKIKEDYLFLENRAFPLRKEPIKISKQNVSAKITEGKDIGQLPLTREMPDVEAVRERMRAKGLLPRHPAISKLEGNKERDDDFYGVQLPRT